eukprot:9000665-Pyramimonas_sp.AAC.1
MGTKKPPLQPKAKSETPAHRTPSGERPKTSARSEERGLDVQMEMPRSKTPRSPTRGAPAQRPDPRQQLQDSGE